MEFARVAEVSVALAATRSRNAKRALLAELLADADAGEVPTVVAWLSAEIAQGRLGVGWRTVAGLRDVPAAAAPALSVTDVDEAFTRLAGISGPGSTARRTELLTGLFTAATGPEQDLLAALLTGELRHGALAGVMTDAIAVASGRPSAAVRRAQMLTGSLPQTAVLAMSPDPGALASLVLQPGRAVAPMLATPAQSLTAAFEAIGPGAIVDYKLDGARIQVHRDGSQVAVFTRNLRDITARVPDLVATALALPCRSVILDGETLTITEDGRPRPFQETMSRFGSATDSAEQPRALRPYFFDCLHLDGADLLDEPLTERLAALAQVAPGLRVPSIVAAEPADVQRHFDAAIGDGHEGVLVKAPGGSYAAGSRGAGWLKIKPVHTLDLVVLAAEWGSGRRTGMLSNLHLGARDPGGGEPVMIGKTFKGLTDALLAWQTSEFPKHERRRAGHVVYLRPEIVVEIAFDGVQRSPRYPGGVALRFARVVRYRPDKNAAEADTIDAVRALLPG